MRFHYQIISIKSFNKLTFTYYLHIYIYRVFQSGGCKVSGEIEYNWTMGNLKAIHGRKRFHGVVVTAQNIIKLILSLLSLLFGILIG